MGESNYVRFYDRADFGALVGNIPSALFAAAVSQLPLSVPPIDVRMTSVGHGVILQWTGDAIPSDEDIELLDALVGAFAGGTTTSQPFEYNSFAVTSSTSTTHANKISETTPPLDAGTYQVIWTSSLRMQAVAANTGVEGKIRLTRSDGVFVEQTDAWDLNVRHAFNGAITFIVQAGQTISAVLSFARLGATGTAEMSGARVTVDKIS